MASIMKFKWLLLVVSFISSSRNSQAWALIAAFSMKNLFDTLSTA